MSNNQENQIQVRTGAIKSLAARIAEIDSKEFKQATFLTAACMALSKNPDLIKCTVPSIQMCVMQAAQDGLLLDGNEAALVPFKDQCTYMPMVQGIIKKAKMHGDVKDISTNIVYENDIFHWMEGDCPSIEHEPTMKDRGAIIGGYVIVTMNDSSKKRLVMPLEDIERIRATSRSPNGIWQKHWSAMAKKTMIRQISKEINLSPDVQRVIRDVDQHYEMETPLTRTTIESTATTVDGTATTEEVTATNPALETLKQPQEEKQAAKA